MSPAPAGVPRAAAWLGGLGLLPFVAGAAAVWSLDEPRHGAALFLLVAYGAIILSFMGAVHWGLALAAPGVPPTRSLVLGVLPALVAWFALSLPPLGTLVVLGAGFVGVYRLDRRAVAAGAAPAWYPALRAPLTAGVLLSLALAGAALLARAPA